MKGCAQAQYDEHQEEIRKSTMSDFEDWVQEHSEKMATTQGKGDTRTIYKSVNALAGKRQKPPPNLTTNGKGSTLDSAIDVAEQWYTFLSKKFAATTAEQGRDPMQSLTPTVGQGGLTREEILKGLAKMSNGKATGLDETPIEIFKVSPVCEDLLVSLLQTV